MYFIYTNLIHTCSETNINVFTLQDPQINRQSHGRTNDYPTIQQECNGWKQHRK
uniref:Uncharacterized protein n=1 Tax=Arundo donax TaxID=35708 RepID=A0A0A9CPN4_ARUDO